MCACPMPNERERGHTLIHGRSAARSRGVQRVRSGPAAAAGASVQPIRQAAGGSGTHRHRHPGLRSVPAPGPRLRRGLHMPAHVRRQNERETGGTRVSDPSAESKSGSQGPAGGSPARAGRGSRAVLLTNRELRGRWRPPAPRITLLRWDAAKFARPLWCGPRPQAVTARFNRHTALAPTPNVQPPRPVW